MSKEIIENQGRLDKKRITDLSAVKLLLEDMLNKVGQIKEKDFALYEFITSTKGIIDLIDRKIEE